MSILRYCCYCFSLKNGSYMSAVYTMVYFSVTLTMIITFALFTGDESDSRNSEPIVEDNGQILPITLNICSASLSLAGLLTCFILLYGLTKDSKFCLIPWMVVVAYASAVDVTYVLYLLSISESFDALSVMFYLGDFTLVLLNVYCIFCVVSQYQSYCRTSETPVN